MHHSHWVSSVKFNSFYDQLLLSSGSDGQIILSCAVSCSSDAFGRNEDDDETGLEGQEGTSSGDDGKTDQKEQLLDGIISKFDENVDSVYAADWSTVDPWTFASVSFDGRVMIDQVPKETKFKVLL